MSSHGGTSIGSQFRLPTTSQGGRQIRVEVLQHMESDHEMHDMGVSDISAPALDDEADACRTVQMSTDSKQFENSMVAHAV